MVDKITNRFNIRVIALFIFLLNSLMSLLGQESPVVTKKITEYVQELKADSLKEMVELKSIIPGIKYDLRYASTDNFMHRRLYKQGKKTFLRLPVAGALANVQQELNKKGLELKIWDAYRPYSVTVKMWEPIKDDRYVADPKKGSGHNRGIAVDLTLIVTATGQELDMGTGFDNFTDTAHADFAQLPNSVLQNRAILRSVMEKYGFKQLETEWWHYYWHEAGFELLDIDFGKFKKNQGKRD